MTKFEKFKNQNSAYCVFNFLVKTKEEVTKEEYDFIIAYDEREKDHFSYIGDYKYLNLNVYSEHDHEKRQYEMEIG